MRLIKSVFTLVTCIMLTQVAHAQKSVVVIPMAGDDVAIAQQHILIDQQASVSGGVSDLCESDVLRTPAQSVQVYAAFHTSVLLPTGVNFYRLNFQYKKDGGNYSSVGPNAFAGGADDTYVQVSNVNVLELDPSSDYQFRLNANTLPNDATSMWCRLALTFSYKLANGKTIVE